LRFVCRIEMESSRGQSRAGVIENQSVIGAVLKFVAF
jgi:hypothetical protein